MKVVQFNSWNSFFKTASSSTKHEKGLLFEKLTINVLKSHPIYASKIRNTWLLREGVPSELKKKLNIPSTDEGIDIIAETYSGEYWAIQCKFKSSNEPPNVKELGTFNNLAHTICKNISMAILFHTGERGVRKKHLMGDNYAEVGLEFWLSLTSDDWNRINDASSSKKIKPIVRHPRDHQKDAIKKSYDHFIKNNETKGRLIMPCGTGKSLTAFWIANTLKAKSVIVAVPSLNLIKQSLEDWTAEFVALDENPKPEWQVICSDDSTSKIQDEFVNDVYSLGIPTTTNVQEITKFLNKKTKSRKIIFTTYQSSERLSEASKKAKFSFDLAILDEAHKTVGVKSKSFATLLSDQNISIKKRMFMTATERVLKGANDDVLSMDDESVYGKRFYQLTFKDAIHSTPQIISDYKILTIAVTNTQIQEIIQKNKLLSDRKNKLEEQYAQSVAAAIALRQATKKYGIKHAISFHKSIKAAESFTNLNLRLNSSKVDKIDLTSYHISSKKSAGLRSQLLDDFKADKLALMTNARCLTEGVNVPTIDCVLFADPKQSIVDIVQAAGRALRVSSGKKYGYIMMPLIVPDDMELEEFSETTPFKQVVRIVAGLSTQDERIVEELRLKSEGKHVKDRRIEISGNIPAGLNFDTSAFTSCIEAKYWERVGRVNWRPFDKARDFVIRLKLNSISDWATFIKSNERPMDIPSNPQRVYLKSGWSGYPDWLGSNTYATISKSFLSFQEARSIVIQHKLKNQREWNGFVKSGKKPENIPSNPQRTYKNCGWKNWNDWLGSENESNRNKRFKTFPKALAFIHKLKLKSTKEWRKYSKSPERPSDIPTNPNEVYKESGWQDWPHWLGTNGRSISNSPFWDFIAARSYVQKLNLKTTSDWKDYCNHVKFPKELPRNPRGVYKNSGWISMGDWLGTGNVAKFQRKYRDFNETKKLVIKLKIKSYSQWSKYAKSGNRPVDVPSHPEITYKSKGWKSWNDFLGKK